MSWHLYKAKAALSLLFYVLNHLVNLYTTQSGPALAVSCPKPDREVTSHGRNTGRMGYSRWICLYGRTEELCRAKVNSSSTVNVQEDPQNPLEDVPIQERCVLLLFQQRNKPLWITLNHVIQLYGPFVQSSVLHTHGWVSDIATIAGISRPEWQ